MDDKNKPYWMPDAQTFLAVSIVVMTFTALIIRMFHTTPEDKMLDTMITILFSTCLVTVYNYAFGSSSGSRSKDDAITKIAMTPVAPIAPVAPVAPIAPIAPVAPIVEVK